MVPSAEPLIHITNDTSVGGHSGALAQARGRSPNRDRPSCCFVRLVDQPHLSLSNETVIPLALELTWAVSWALIDEPSEPVR